MDGSKTIFLRFVLTPLFSSWEQILCVFKCGLLSNIRIYLLLIIFKAWFISFRRLWCLRADRCQILLVEQKTTRETLELLSCSILKASFLWRLRKCPQNHEIFKSDNQGFQTMPGSLFTACGILWNIRETTCTKTTR